MRESWVDKLISDSSHVETPFSYLWWSFLSCISAVAGNNYYLTTLQGDLIYRPNLYIMLLGESGLGKNWPIGRARLLVSSSETTRVIAGRSSIQAIVKELGTAKSRNGQPPFNDSKGFIINGELSTAIIQDPDSLTVLTDLYDCPNEWTNLLKGEGPEKLKKPYITALFGSSPAHFYDSIPQSNIEGGYIGRNLIVYEEKRSKDVDLLDDSSSEVVSDDKKFDKVIVPKYVPHLKNIAAKEGRLVPTPEARELYNIWRRKWRKEQPYDKTGFMNRVPDHVLKVSMCLTLSYEDMNGGNIEAEDVELAIKRVTDLIYATKRTSEGRGSDILSQQSKLVLDYLIEADDNKLTRKQLLWKGYGNYNSFVLDQVVDNLLEMGWIKRQRIGVGKNIDWLYFLAGEPLDSLQKFRSQQK